MSADEAVEVVVRIRLDGQGRPFGTLGVLDPASASFFGWLELMAQLAQVAGTEHP